MTQAVLATVITLAVAVFVAGLPAHYREVGTLPSLSSSQRATLYANLAEIDVSLDFYAGWFAVAIPVIIATVFFLVAAVVVWRRPDEPMALFVALLLVLFGATRSDANEALANLYPNLKTLSSVLESLSLTLVFVFFYLFPDGRFVPRWIRWLTIPLVGYTLLVAFSPGSPFDPKSWSGVPYTVFFGGWFLTGVAAQVYRYRLVAGPVERQQTKWVFFGFAAALAAYLGMILVFFVASTPPQPGSLANFVAGTLFYCTSLFIPLSIGVAILRYRLWDIDFIINRTLVYGALTASVVALYVLLVGGGGALLQARSDVLVSLLAAGIVAVLFAPLRDRLQRGVNRMMYGDRDDPYGVLSRLGQRLEATFEPKAILPTIVETVRDALKLPYVAIAMRRGNETRIAAAHGSPTGEQTALPLTYGGETVGELILSSRAPGEGFSPTDRRLLEDLARSAEVAVHAVKLTQDLQRSRERLVNLREEERRRLRRDLHDGLGPTLGSLTLGLDVSRRLMKSDPEQASYLLEQLKDQTKDAVTDIRRLVYGLRPPALDDFGLGGAVRELAAKYGSVANGCGAEETGQDSLTFFLDIPEELPPLPAAMEVAGYRIIQEAITNVVRHARAGRCYVRISVHEKNRTLELEVSDDGVGLPDELRAGVGTTSMAERAEELGGTCSVESQPAGGARIVACLPLPEEEE